MSNQGDKHEVIKDHSEEERESIPHIKKTNQRAEFSITEKISTINK